jgi:hypothetical protein
VPDDTKVFDVSKPGRAAPQPTSRPIIRDNSPTTSDPMMTEEKQAAVPQSSATSGTSIQVSMGDEEESVNVNRAQIPSAGTTFEPEQSATDNVNDAEAQSQLPEALTGATIPPHELEEMPDPAADKKAAGANFTPLTSLVPSTDGKEDKSNFSEPKSHHIDSLPENHGGDASGHMSDPLPIARGAGPKRRMPKTLKWVILAILAALVAAYLAVDAGLIKSDVNLPFHIFNKQKKSTSAASPAPITQNSPPVSQPPAQSAVPAGFTKYDLTDAGVSFAYPTAWGTPAVTKDPGFSKRGGTNKSDGTYAYLVNFGTNKDVGLALTSSKYLPATQGNKTPPYYGYLGWCNGTNDGKYYQQELKFTTNSGVDTPTTIACDVPMDPAPQQVDSNTVLQTKVAQEGTVVGDIYTMNLTSNKDFPVLRARDGAMKNGDDIKKLLNTVKVSATSTSSSSTTISQ